MGQHTWFGKSLKLYNEETELYKKLDAHETGDIYLDEMEIYQIQYRLNEIHDENETDYHDIFRTNKRNEDKTYTDDIITSKEECDKWLEENKAFVYFSDTVFDTEEQIKEKKIHKLKWLNEFWDKYPNGVIYFT